MSYAMGLDSWQSGKVFYNCLADPINLHNDDYTLSFYFNPVECIVFLMQLSAIREHTPYAPAKEFNDAEDRIYSEVKSIDWWWNEQVRSMNFVQATMILTASIATAAACNHDCPFIRQFRADTSYNQFGQQEPIASIFDSLEH